MCQHSLAYWERTPTQQQGEESHRAQHSVSEESDAGHANRIETVVAHDVHDLKDQYKQVSSLEHQQAKEAKPATVDEELSDLM